MWMSWAHNSWNNLEIRIGKNKIFKIIKNSMYFIINQKTKLIPEVRDCLRLLSDGLSVMNNAPSIHVKTI